MPVTIYLRFIRVGSFWNLRVELRIFASLAAGLGAAWLYAAPVLADNWQASIYESAAPRHLVGVDKKKHTFNFFEKKSPFKLRYSYPCVTGQLPGDKQQVNDLRTPEGIYFVEYKIANGLDFREYGGIAYTLNYPNPVDRLRGKTGHGIWIHSKGFDLVPTRGCVAIDLDNIAEVGPLLLPGTPVVVAEELKAVRKDDDGNLARLCGLMAEWSNAWAARSAHLFDFYDPDAYSRATENFALFRQNKERLFKILSFIKIYNREIHALEGPGYWVTWSEQFYTASNLSTEGIRRLYWQKNARGDFRIVGMEWTPRDVGMRAAFQKGMLVAEGPVTTATDGEAPLAPRLDMPESEPVVPAAPEKEAKGITASLVALAENLVAISDPLVPRRKKDAGRAPDEIIWGSGKTLNEPDGKKTGSQTPEVPKQPDKPADADSQAGQTVTTPQPERATPALELPGAPRGPEKLTLNDNLRQELIRREQAWLGAMRNRDGSIEDFYDAKHYNRMPANAGVPRGASLNSALQQMRREFGQPWLEVVSRVPEIGTNGQVVTTRTAMLVASPQGVRQGMQTLWWRKEPNGQFKIVGSAFKQEAQGLEANYLEKVSGPVASMLEAWRKAWEAGNLDEYMKFYAGNAWQQGRSGAGNIRNQKRDLWGRVKPVEVRLSGLRVSLDKNGLRADMTQTYTNSSGHSDKGVKTLYLRYDGKDWRIQREDWANMEKAVSP